MVFQICNYLIPLIVIPFLVRTLGVESFGKWMFALSFIIFIRVIVSYGFDLTASRQAAVEADDRTKLSKLLTSVTVCRLLIWVLCVFAILLLSQFFRKIDEIKDLILIGSSIVLGEAILPVWLFLGVERLGVITILRLCSRLTNLALLLVFVRGPLDTILVPVFEGILSLALGCLALTMASRTLGLRLSGLSFKEIKLQARSGAAVFVSTLSVQMYTTAHTIVLGMLIGPAAVTSYSIAEKVYSAVRGLLNPLIQAVFPVMARMHDSSREEFSRTYKSALSLILIFLLIVGALIFVCAPFIVRVVEGHFDHDTLVVMQLFASAFPFAIGGFLSPMLIVRGGDIYLMVISIASGLLGIVLAIPLAVKLGAPGAALAFLAVQIFGAIALFLTNLKLAKQKIW